MEHAARPTLGSLAASAVLSIWCTRRPRKRGVGKVTLARPSRDPRARPARPNGLPCTRFRVLPGNSPKANNIELAYVPTNASWLNGIEAQFRALRDFTLDGTDHRSLGEQNSMIRPYIVWRNRHAHDKTPRELVKRASLA